MMINQWTGGVESCILIRFCNDIYEKEIPQERSEISFSTEQVT